MEEDRLALKPSAEGRINRPLLTEYRELLWRGFHRAPMATFFAVTVLAGVAALAAILFEEKSDSHEEKATLLTPLSKGALAYSGDRDQGFRRIVIADSERS
ncbi:hypothetical protein [Paraburkholderia phenoliruptrix]|uniref:hypothetical protein n=1 Tax=Paraburkholderia phenoliruptrix TaxID=252970 RepID=UPI0034CDDFAF